MDKDQAASFMEEKNQGHTVLSPFLDRPRWLADFPKSQRLQSKATSGGKGLSQRSWSGCGVRLGWGQGGQGMAGHHKGFGLHSKFSGQQLKGFTQGNARIRPMFSAGRRKSRWRLLLWCECEVTGPA